MGLSPGAQRYPGQSALALHIIDAMMEQGFDVAHSKYLREGQSITHAVTFVFARILQGKNIPVVPSCKIPTTHPISHGRGGPYEFGIALRNAVETWKSNARVAVLGLGWVQPFRAR